MIGFLPCTNTGLRFISWESVNSSISSGSQSATSIVFVPEYNQTAVIKRYKDFEDFYAERKVLPLFKHNPYIIQAICEDSHNHALYLEHGIDGDLAHSNLHDINPKSLLFLTRQLVKAVQVIHQKGIVHCDIKPANVVRRGNHLKLIDFGLSLPAGQNNRGRGTIKTMAPEILLLKYFSPDPVDGYATDWWSLGVTIFYLCAKVLSVHGKSDHDDKSIWHYGYYPYKLLKNSDGLAIDLEFPLAKPVIAFPKEIVDLLFGEQGGLLSIDPKRRMPNSLYDANWPKVEGN